MVTPVRPVYTFPSPSDATTSLADFPDPIPGIIPFGSTTLFGGASGSGKTTFVAEWVKRWRDGRTICGYRTNRPTEFYYLTTDRPWAEDHQKRFARVGITDIRHFALADDDSIPLEELRNAGMSESHLAYCLEQLDPKPGGHVIIDPVAPFFVIGNQNHARDVATTLHCFTRLTRAYQVHFTLLIHFNKQAADKFNRTVDRISGSQAFAAFSGTTIYALEPDDPKAPNAVTILGWKPRRAPPEEFKFVRDAQTGLFIPYVGLEDVGTVTDRSSRVLELIPAEGIRTGDLVALASEKLNVSDRSIFRDLKTLAARCQTEKDTASNVFRRKPS